MADVPVKEHAATDPAVAVTAAAVTAAAVTAAAAVSTVAVTAAPVAAAPVLLPPLSLLESLVSVDSYFSSVATAKEILETHGPRFIAGVVKTANKKFPMAWLSLIE